MEQWKMDKPDYIQKIEDGERRFVSFPVEYREDDEGTIEGIASEVNKYYDLGFFEERIAKGAFDEVLKDDVRALINHDPNLVLARTKSKTLDLFTDKKGNLAYKFKTPNRSYAKDLEDAVKSGDIDQSSFAFRVAEEKWEWRDDNEDLKKDRRTITKIEKLYDVSAVTYPASPSTTVAARKLDDHSKELSEAKLKRNQNILKLAQAKLTLNNL
jgi:HK97 family phage prohead protease